MNSTISCSWKWFRIILLAGAVLSLKGFVVADDIVIREVRFEGLEELKPEDLLKRITSKEGTTYDRERLRDDLKRLAPLAWNWPQVSKRDVEGGIRLTFILRENPKLSSVEFVGNSQVETETLRKVIRMEPGDVLTRDVLEQVSQLVREEYRARGYLRTQVRAVLAQEYVGDEKKKGRALQVFVNEGQRKQVKDVEVLGNKDFGSMRLKAMLETRGSWLFLKNYFDEAAFEDDLKVLAQFYHRNGYFDAEVERGTFKYDEVKQTITPTIVVSEGPRYHFGEMSTRGNTYFTNEEVLDPFAKLIGEPFKGKDFDIGLKLVRDMYAASGFVTTEVGDEMDFDRDMGLVKITLVIRERVRAEVGRVIVQRPEALRDEDESWFSRAYNRVSPPVELDVILKEITLKPGDVYDKREEEESVARLRRLNVFDEVSIESRSTDEAGVRDVVISVQEGVTGNIFAGVGYNEYYGGYVWADFTERNVWGEADRIQAKVMLGTEQSGASVSYFDRHLNGSDRSLLTEVRHVDARRPGFDEKNTGGLVELGTPINDRWKAYVRGRLEYVRLDEGKYEPYEDYNIDYTVAALRLKLVHDTRLYQNYNGVRSLPSSGHLNSIAVEMGDADGAMTKLIGTSQWFRKLSEKTVFAADWRAGLMAQDSWEIGPTERFYLGGSSDLRGFKFRHAGPHDSGDDDVPLGGATKLLARNELRYALADNITGLAFFDAGMLDREAFKWDTPRMSTGLGVRLELRGVAAGLDVAAPINADDDDQTRYFHLSLSTQRGF